MTPKRAATRPHESPRQNHNGSRPNLAQGADVNAVLGRDALGAYIRDPSAFPSPQSVISSSDAFVAIQDMYPKSTIHMLLLPRDESITLLHPFEAFADPKLLASVCDEVAKLKQLAASELRRRFGRFSNADSSYNAALDADEAPSDLPSGRNWETGIIAGVHAHPSMSHLHVHIMSVDRVSACMRHRRHYNSFSTPFFVPIEDFPLAQEDPRRQHAHQESYLTSDLKCWRCGAGFGNRFKRLKEHLEEELEDWKQE